MRCAKGRKILAEAEKRKSGSNPNSAHSSINSNSQNALLKKSTSANQLATQSSTTVPPVPPIPPPFQKTSFSPSSSASSLNRSKQRKQNGNSDDERPIGAALIDRKQSIENGRTSSSSPLSGGSSNDKITRKYGQRLITPEVTADQRLVDVIDRYKGNPQDNGEIVNKTRFGENGQPLVPLTLQEIAANPAVDLSKYQMKRKNSKKQQAQPCATCSCTDFAKSHFNEAKCANCFHIH
jgi:hypothetical protein